MALFKASAWIGNATLMESWLPAYIPAGTVTCLGVGASAKKYLGQVMGVLSHKIACACPL